MRIVFIGASQFGLAALEVATSIPDMEVVGIVTNPANFRISYAPEGVKNVLHADMQAAAQRYHVPCYVMQESMKEPALLEAVRAWQPELFLVVGWYHLLPAFLREMAPAVGLHASLLPDYSGGAPLVWAMIHGEKNTGITLFEFAGGVDNGPIIAQAETLILPGDTITTLYERIQGLGLAMLREQLPRLADGTAIRTSQDESRRRTFPQRKPQDGRIDWQLPPQQIHDFVRAQTAPYPGAFTELRGATLTLWKTRLLPGFEASAPVGTARLLQGKIVVACGKGQAIEIAQVSFAGQNLLALPWWKTLGLDDAATIQLG